MSIAEVAAEHKLRRKISTNSNNDDVPKHDDADEDVVENSANHVQRRNSVYL